jgi:hypothetical protein
MRTYIDPRVGRIKAIHEGSKVYSRDEAERILGSDFNPGKFYDVLEHVVDCKANAPDEYEYIALINVFSREIEIHFSLRAFPRAMQYLCVARISFDYSQRFDFIDIYIYDQVERFWDDREIMAKKAKKSLSF